jgi:pantoate--beta-alanine ligase
MPVVANTGAELQEALEASRSAGHRIGFVPTMGALHDGHASLMDIARDRVDAGPLVVSIFVNPLQFGVAEDLTRYPRTLDADLSLCARRGVNLVFAPSEFEVYPGGPPQVSVSPGPLGAELEGASRPGHFAGVLTVVAKLFGLVRPDVAVFGEKDFQQLALIRRMAADLCFGVDIVGAPTLREPDGLAMSSRNRFLSPSERQDAAVLSRALREAVAVAGRDGGPAAALTAASAVLAQVPSVVVDYLRLTDLDLAALPAMPRPGTQGRILVAARVGSTRLIDNLPVLFG